MSIPHFACVLAALTAALPLPAQDRPLGELTFLEVSGKNLNEREFDLPGGFEAKLNLVFMAFERRHQRDVDTWLPFAAGLEQRYADLRFYELPTMADFPQAFRSFVDNGMRRGIPSLDTRSRTICLYLDRAPLLRALDIPDTSAIWAMLVTREGKLLWRSRGAYDEAAGKSLEQVLAKSARQRVPSDRDLVKTLAGEDSMRLLFGALRDTGLAKELRARGPFTVFAPTDAAVRQLGDDRLRALQDPKNAEKLRSLLLRHVARGYLDRKALQGAKRVPTLAGSWIRIRQAKDGVRADGARVTGEVPCANGVLLTLDRVLRPAAVDPAPRRATL